MGTIEDANRFLNDLNVHMGTLADEHDMSLGETISALLVMIVKQLDGVARNREEFNESINLVLDDIREFSGTARVLQ